jgi:2-haloacid dehalogenase
VEGRVPPGGPIVFDAYGTLFDPAALAEPLERRYPGQGASLASSWRSSQIRHTWLRSLMGRWTDFDAITAETLAQTLDGAGLAADASLTADLLAAYRSLAPYPDVAAALALLPPDRPRAILTNGTQVTVEATVAASGFSAALPLVLSAEDARVYKPSPRVYALVTSAFGVTPADVTFVSGNAWDCAGAAAFGFRVVRIRRTAESREFLGDEPTAVIGDLRELAAFLVAPAGPAS